MHLLGSIVAEYVVIDVLSAAGGRWLLNRETMNVHVVAARVLIRWKVTLFGIQIVETGV